MRAVIKTSQVPHIAEDPPSVARGAGIAGIAPRVAETAGRQPFAGRTEQLRHLEQLAVRPPVGGAPRVALVHGPGGIGKSRLLRELRDRLARRGVCVLAGSATEFERMLPFAAFFDVIDSLEAAGVRLPYDVEGPDGLSGLEPFQLYRAVRDAIDAVGTCGTVGTVDAIDRIPGSGGTLLVLDDVHWADAASLSLVEFLLHRPPAGLCGMVLSFRTGTCPTSLTRALSDFAGSVSHVAVPPLEPFDVDILFPDQSAGRRRALAEASAGNPLYLGLLADLPTRELIELTGAAPVLDETVASLLVEGIRADLDALGDPERLVVRAAAVGGAEVGAELVAAIAQLSEDEVCAQLDLLAERGILSAQNDRFRFAHPLLRSAAYRLSGPGWRTRAHRRAATHLALLDAPLPQQAQHLQHSLHPGDEPGRIRLVRAAVSALSSAPASSAQWLTRVLETLPTEQAEGQADEQADEQRSEVELLLARAHLASGHLGQADRVLQSLLARPGSRRREAITLLAQCDRIRGRYRRAYAMLEAHAGDGRGPDNGLIAVELATIDLMAGRIDTGIRRVRALTTAAGQHDTAVRAAAAALHALAAAGGGEIKTAQDAFGDADRRVEAMSDEELRAILDPAIPPMGWTAYLLEEHERGQYFLERAVTVARSHGHTYVLPHLYTIQALLFTRQGRLAEALAAGQDAEETARAFEAADILGMARAGTLRPLLWAKGPEAVREIWEQMAAQPEPDTDWFGLSVATILVDVGVQAGFDPPADPARLLQLDQTRQADPNQASRWAYAALAALAHGSGRQAQTWSRRAMDAAAAMALDGQFGAACLAHGRVELTLGEPAAAAAHADAAIGAFTRKAMPVQLGLAHLLAADAAIRLGDLDTAGRNAVAARDLFTRQGADWLTRRAVSTQRRIAAGRPRRRGSAPQLSQRERQVAELVAQGLSNVDISDRLYLSPRTVESHVGRVLAKLGLTSRSGVARRLTGIAEDGADLGEGGGV